jgi:transcriptional regulator with XRE-family HTH domain
MAELTNKQKKDFAKAIYLREHVTQKEIADRVGISQVTLSKWVNDGKWDDLKTAISITRNEQIGVLYTQLKAINDMIAAREKGQNFATPKEADAILKLATSISKMEQEPGLMEAVSVAEEFLRFLRKIDPAKAIEMSYDLDAFIKTKL